ncbi:hypothetical protein [Methylobacterium durans]|nr:hypothetical protein [Methylobacterium durans]
MLPKKVQQPGRLPVVQLVGRSVLLWVLASGMLPLDPIGAR